MALVTVVGGDAQFTWSWDMGGWGGSCHSAQGSSGRVTSPGSNSVASCSASGCTATLYCNINSAGLLSTHNLNCYSMNPDGPNVATGCSINTAAGSSWGQCCFPSAKSVGTCGTVGETEVIGMSCDTKIARVLFAAYGNPTGSCAAGFQHGSCDSGSHVRVER
jgi:hypothetical protein